LLGLTGCAAPTAVPPAEGIALLPSGVPLLRCREACLARWRAAAPQAALLDREGRWRELAWLVLSIGYQDDLTLYYLGRATAGMDYPVGAASYFQQSRELSGTTVSCLHMSGSCGGILLPQASSAELAALDRRLHPQPRRQMRRVRRHRAEPAVAGKAKPGEPNEAEGPVPLSPAAGMPPPPAVPAAAAAPPPPAPAPPPAAPPAPARPPPPGTGEFIEPPPAR
jgi:hypothetical protein